MQVGLGKLEGVDIGITCRLIGEDLEMRQLSSRSDILSQSQEDISEISNLSPQKGNIIFLEQDTRQAYQAPSQTLQPMQVNNNQMYTIFEEQSQQSKLSSSFIGTWNERRMRKMQTFSSTSLSFKKIAMNLEIIPSPKSFSSMSTQTDSSSSPYMKF